MTHSGNYTEHQSALSVEIADNFDAPSIYSSNWIKEDADIGFDSYAKDLIRHHLAEKSWPMIDWQLIISKNPELWHIVGMLTPVGYKQLFPSFLVHCIFHQRTSSLANLFIESHLNINNVYNEDELKFYSSLSDKQAACVSKVLEYAKCEGNPLAAEALDSYWRAFI